MDLKEKIIGSVITMLSTKFNSTDLTFVQNVLTVCLHDYTVMQTKELPSNEVLNNDNIIRHYMATKKMEGLSIKTLKTYKHHIYKFFDFSHLFVQDVDTNSVRFYLASLETHASKSFTDDARRILNTFFSFCEDEGYITKNPVKKIKRIKQNKIMKAPYSDIEVEMIRDACSTPREKALVSFLFSTGARREEITKIKNSDVNLYERSVIIHGKGGKDRIVYFSARCEKHLSEYMNSKDYNSEYLFCSSKAPHGKLSNEGLAQIVKQIGKRSGVNNVHLHRFRRWFGTYMANQGVPLQDLKEMMGHSKLDTTNNYYVFMNGERIKLNYKSHAA